MIQHITCSNTDKIRWPNACNSLLSGCHITLFGICTSLVSMTSVIWRFVIYPFLQQHIADFKKKQEMEEERKAREKEEQDKVERMKKIKDQFVDPNSQWEKDKTDIQNAVMKEKKENERKEAAAAEETKKPAATEKAEATAEAKVETAKVESKTDSVKAQ